MFSNAISHSVELRELSSTDLKFLEDGLDGGGSAFCDLDTILDDFQADTHILLTNPVQLLAHGQGGEDGSARIRRRQHLSKWRSPLGDPTQTTNRFKRTTTSANMFACISPQSSH